MNRPGVQRGVDVLLMWLALGCGLPLCASPSGTRPAKQPEVALPAEARPPALKSGTQAVFRSVNAEVFMTVQFTETGVHVCCAQADGAQAVSFTGPLESQKDNPEAFGGTVCCLEPQQAVEVQYAFPKDGSLVATVWKGADQKEPLGLAWYRVVAKGSDEPYFFPEWAETDKKGATP